MDIFVYQYGISLEVCKFKFEINYYKDYISAILLGIYQKNTNKYLQ